MNCQHCVQKNLLWTLLLLLVLAVGLTAPAAAGDDAWTTSSLIGYRVRTVAIDRANANVVYVGTDKGLLVSQDGGENWTGRPLAGEVSSVYVHSQNADILYATVHNQLVKIEVGGRGSIPIGSSLLNRPYWVGAHPLRPDVLYVMAQDGLYRSPDSGVTWSGAGLPVAQQVAALAFDPSNADVSYVALADGQGVFHTGDGGASWTLISQSLEGGSAYVYRIGVDTAGALFLQTHGGIHRSTDGGGSWQLGQHEELQDGNMGRAGFAVDGVRANRLYQAWGGSIFRSDDGGTSWTSFADVLPDQPSALIADPTREGVLYAIVGEVLYQSLDGGANWQAPYDTFALTMVAHPTEAGALIGFSPQEEENNVWRSDDSGRTWQLSNSGLEGIRIFTILFEPGNNDVLYAGAAQGLYRSTDGGFTWVLTGLPTNVSVTTMAVDPQNPANLTVGGPGGLLRSDNGGESWTAVSLSGRVSSLVVQPQNPQTIYAIVDEQLQRSDNGGQSWRSLAHPSQRVQSILLKPDEPDVIYVGASDGVYISQDGGAGWSRAQMGLPDSDFLSILAVDRQRPEMLYVGLGSTIFVSPDAGSNWFLLGEGLPGLTVERLLAGAGEPLTLYATFQNGAGGVWRYTMNSLPQPPTPTPAPTDTPTPYISPTPWWDTVATPTPFGAFSPATPTTERIAVVRTIEVVEEEVIASDSEGIGEEETEDEEDREDSAAPASVVTRPPARRAANADLWSGIAVGIAGLLLATGGGFLLWRRRRAQPDPGGGDELLPCPNCGVSTPPGARFCIRCGYQLGD